jgi:hypothetical protein
MFQGSIGGCCLALDGQNGMIDVVKGLQTTKLLAQAFFNQLVSRKTGRGG